MDCVLVWVRAMTEVNDVNLTPKIKVFHAIDARELVPIYGGHLLKPILKPLMAPRSDSFYHC